MFIHLRLLLPVLDVLVCIWIERKHFFFQGSREERKNSNNKKPMKHNQNNTCNFFSKEIFWGSGTGIAFFYSFDFGLSYQKGIQYLPFFLTQATNILVKENRFGTCKRKISFMAFFQTPSPFSLIYFPMVLTAVKNLTLHGLDQKCARQLFHLLYCFSDTVLEADIGQPYCMHTYLTHTQFYTFRAEFHFTYVGSC